VNPVRLAAAFAAFARPDMTTIRPRLVLSVAGHAAPEPVPGPSIAPDPAQGRIFLA